AEKISRFVAQGKQLIEGLAKPEMLPQHQLPALPVSVVLRTIKLAAVHHMLLLVVTPMATVCPVPMEQFLYCQTNNSFLFCLAVIRKRIVL
ncbi:MAG: hypothetical protein K2X81_19330, partial [Candidatus Obscuribacterales bacterium]|nr:hypothetical protein [Candidatus Obscuribacterales bacterium]